ncbi:hypothetical protein [Candidatus Ruminimicrobium bovinum]|uniref:hypothetical protein n=1 Tax=Candidatus Ruminimicrobium bovinum TaxID=3242779 RepID=UPI0039B9AE12
MEEENYTLDKFPKIENLNNLQEEDKNIIWKCIKNMVYTHNFFRGNDRKIAARKRYIENNVYRKLNLESKSKKKQKKQEKKEGYILREKDELIEKLYVLILDEKNTLGNIISFINTYGQVKDNEEEFIKYCKDISRKLDISRDYDTKAPNLSEKGNNEEGEDNKSNPIEDQIKQKDWQYKDESELEKQQNKEEELNKMAIQNEQDNELQRIIKKYLYYIFEEIKNKYSKYINLFIISYHINKDILDRNININSEPTNMNRLFYKEDKLYKYLELNRTDLNNKKDEIEYKINNYDLSSKKNIKEILDRLCLRPEKGKQIKDRTNLVDNKTVEQIYRKTEEEKKKILKENLRKFLFSEIFKTSRDKSKEEILNEIIDPLSFWRNFYSEFRYKIENTTYYSLLEYVDSRADRRKKKIYEILDDIFNTLEDNNYKFDSEEDREIIIELDNTIKQRIIELIKLSMPDKNIRNNEEKGKNRQQDLVKKLKEHKIKKCDGYKEDIGHYITDNNILTEEAKEELQKHLIHCDECLKYLNDLQSGNKYINGELEKGKIFVVKPIKTLTLNEELINYCEQEFLNEPNSYTQENLILAYIKTGKIEKAKEFYNKSIEEIYKIINNKEVKNG